MNETLPILVSEHDDIPIYVQIAHQITYLIYSQKLGDGSRLPTVRALATQLQVNPNTVTQAYTELQKAGLISSQRGRGTFVRDLSIALDDSWAQRHELLREVLASARRRAHALGFTDTELRTQLFGMLQESGQACEVAFVAPELSARKYATALTALLQTHGVEVLPLALEDLELGAEAADQLLRRCYYVITPVSQKGHVEELLGLRSTHHAVLGISLDITPTAVAGIGRLPAERSVCLFTSQRYLAIALNILHTYSRHPFAAMRRVLDTAPEETLATAFEEADVVVHTFGVRPLLDRHGVPAGKRLELEFRASEDSVARLREHFGSRVGGRVAGGSLVGKA